jgi:histidinol dehydrogenase
MTLQDDPATLARRVRSLVPSPRSVERPVRKIVERVRNEGDHAVLELTREHDTKGRNPAPLRVSEDELRAALDALPRDVARAIELAAANVGAVARASLGDEQRLELAQGQRVRLREIPVRRAAVYAPGGRFPYPSTVVMGAVPARVAGVDELAVCAPPGRDGAAHPVILGACALLGITEVYRMGGAQAVAALAYGTDTVPPVDVIVGPGNRYVQEAKRQVSGVVGIDGIAGPSELVVLLDQGEHVGLVVLDLLAQAEHGGDSPVVAISTRADVLDALADELARLAGERPTVAPAVAALVHAPSLQDGLAFAEAFAPEHLQLVGDGAEALADRVRSAGCLFVGPRSATAFGDYVAGSNHVLPTGGAARFASALSVHAFRRRMAEVRIGAAADELAPAGATLARAEGFEVHAESMEARMRENRTR